MQTTIGSHVSEEMLMRYASGELPDDAQSELEEHILMCEACQLNLETIDEHLQSAAEAAREIREEDRLRQTNRVSSWFRGGRQFAWAALLATILICAIAPLSNLRKSVVGPPAEIALSASRGAAQALVSRSQSGQVVLKIDTSELPELPVYELQMVNDAGREIWSGQVPKAGQELRVSVPRALDAGQYWVRLFTKDWNQIREFGLIVE